MNLRTRDMSTVAVNAAPVETKKEGAPSAPSFYQSSFSQPENCFRDRSAGLIYQSPAYAGRLGSAGVCVAG